MLPQPMGLWFSFLFYFYLPSKPTKIKRKTFSNNAVAHIGEHNSAIQGVDLESRPTFFSIEILGISTSSFNKFGKHI
jgi:hypothetical protein